VLGDDGSSSRRPLHLRWADIGDITAVCVSCKVRMAYGMLLGSLLCRGDLHEVLGLWRAY
jgi:hypothetical protein